jgi:hypothetical protein
MQAPANTYDAAQSSAWGLKRPYGTETNGDPENPRIVILGYARPVPTGRQRAILQNIETPKRGKDADVPLRRTYATNEAFVGQHSRVVPFNSRVMLRIDVASRWDNAIGGGLFVAALDFGYCPVSERNGAGCGSPTPCSIRFCGQVFWQSWQTTHSATRLGGI